MIFLNIGEFGVVYMGQLKANTPGSSDKTVAIKTLKGKCTTTPDL